MIFSEGRLRQVIRQALSEGLMTEAMDKEGVKKVQQAILDSAPKKDGESETARARRLIGASKPDGDFGKTSKKTWTDVLKLDLKALGDDPDAAVKLVKNSTKNFVEKAVDKAKARAEEKQKNMPNVIKAVRAEWDARMRKHKGWNRNQIEMMKGQFQQAHDSLNRDFNVDESEIYKQFKWLEGAYMQSNAIAAKNILYDRIMAEWLIKNDPDCENWRWDIEKAPWGGGKRYQRRYHAGTTWKRATKAQARRRKVTNYKTMRRFYGITLSYGELARRYDPLMEKVKEYPPVDGEDIKGMQARLNGIIDKAGGGPRAGNGDSQKTMTKVASYLKDVIAAIYG